MQPPPTIKMKTTVIRKTKRPDGMGRWPAYVLAEDTFGTWLYSPLGCIYRGQRGETTGECEVGQGDRDRGHPVLHLVPKIGWWFAAWYRLDGAATIGIDICTPPACVDNEWRYTDLELD